MMVSLALEVLVSVAVLVTGQILYVFAANYIRAFTSPIAVLPGPKRDSLLRGNFVERSEPNSQRTVQSWFVRYGRAIRYFSILGVIEDSHLIAVRTLMDMVVSPRNSVF